jgi:uncharacterized membrane protein
MARHPRWVRTFLADADLEAVARAVADAEAGTSGEIRVHLDARCRGEAMTRAIAVFERLGMTRTALRNGVLIYLAIKDRKLAVIGDAGIHARVTPEYWERLKETLVVDLRRERPRDGLVQAVRDVGEVLRRHFPRAPDDKNELTDQVSVE